MRTITKQYLELVETIAKILTEEDYDRSNINFELVERIQSFVEMILWNGLAVIEVDEDRKPEAIIHSYHAIIPLIQDTVGDLFWGGISLQDPNDPNMTHGFDLVNNLMDLTDIIKDRLGDLSPIVISQDIDDDVALYLGEAHRAYRLGMDKASILLSYSAVELQVRLAIFTIDQNIFLNTPHQSLAKYDKDSSMNTFLMTLSTREVLSKELISSIKRLRNKRNQVAHRDPESQEFDLEVPVKDLINDAGKVVLHLLNALN